MSIQFTVKDDKVIFRVSERAIEGQSGASREEVVTPERIGQLPKLLALAYPNETERIHLYWHPTVQQWLAFDYSFTFEGERQGIDETIRGPYLYQNYPLAVEAPTGAELEEAQSNNTLVEYYIMFHHSSNYRRLFKEKFSGQDVGWGWH